MAYRRHPGNSMVEYCLCGALIAIAALSALAGLGLAINTKFQGMGAEISALQTGQSGKLPAAPSAPGGSLPLTGLPGGVGSITSPLPSGMNIPNPNTAVHAPVTDTTGTNGTSEHTQTSPSNPPGDSSTTPDKGSMSNLGGNTQAAFQPPVNKTLLTPP